MEWILNPIKENVFDFKLFNCIKTENSVYYSNITLLYSS